MTEQLIDESTLMQGFADYPPVLTTAQVAELLAMNVQEVRRLSRDGRLPSRRIGKAYRFFRDEIVAWLNSAVGEP
jgi:excisionase family DNA binding protein